MHICLFISSLHKNGGGPSRSVPIMAKGLSEIGIKTTLMTVESEEMNLHILDDSNVTISLIPAKYTHSQLKSLIINSRFDIIHLQGLWLPVYHEVASIARQVGIPYMMTPRGTLEPWSLQQRIIKKKLAMLLYQKKDLQKSACILATAKMEAAHIRQLGIHSPVCIIPNGIDVSEYECRTMVDKPEIKKQILFLSRIHPKKGIELLIDAWKDLEDSFPEWSVIIAGNGEESYIANLKQQIKNLGLNDSIRIVPPVFGREKRHLYCESALFVLPTHSENFGMVIAEALSCGVPVITTNGTPWMVLNDEGIGWCIDLSKDRLKETIYNAVTLGIDTLFEIGQKGSHYVHTTLQYQVVAKHMSDVYQWLLYRRLRPSTMYDSEGLAHDNDL